MHAILVMLLVIPAWLCTMLSGLLFGPLLGTVCALAGATLGATSVFMVARPGLTDLAERAGPRVVDLAAGFRADGFRYLIALRLMPVLPFTLVNIAAALAGQSLRSYVLATVIGVLPSIIIYASLGDLLMDLVRQDHLPDMSLLWQPRVLLPVFGLVLLALLALLTRPVRDQTRPGTKAPRRA